LNLDNSIPDLRNKAGEMANTIMPGLPAANAVSDKAFPM